MRIILIFLICIVQLYGCVNTNETTQNDTILSYTINPQSSFLKDSNINNNNELKFYWKNKNGTIYENFERLNNALKNEGKKLVFAMNGGMFKEDLSPVGLYIENGVQLTALDTVKNGYGNFYLQPNGVFYLDTKNKPTICSTTAFNSEKDIKYATQSGPMLVINGEIHTAFNKESKNLNIRNGVGVLPNGDLIFALSKKEVNFFEFANFFKSKGCENALYLDGFVSKVYLPSQNWVQHDGSFGVIIAVVAEININA